MTWYPIAFLPPQIENQSGIPYSGAVLKAYAVGTNTPIAMATDTTGATTTATMLLNASGYTTYQGTIVIPHLQQDYKMALYPDQASADANSGAIWTIPEVKIAEDTNTAFIQYFDGDGVTSTFTLSESFGNDEKILMVFADRAIQNYTANTDFASDTIWTKGAGWTIGAGVATAAGAISTAIQQNATSPIIQGQSYTVEFTVTASAGTLTPSVGGNAGTTRGAGTWRETIIAGSTQVIAFTGVAFTGTLDNASVKATGAVQRIINRDDEFTLIGNQLTLNNIPPSGTKNVLVFAPSRLLGAANNAAAAAATSEANALAYKNQAQAFATSLNATSATSVLIGTGSKSFTTQTDKNYTAGQFITISSAANSANYMNGQVTSYSTATGALVVNVGVTGGSGTFADWNINVSGAQGAAGGPVSDGTYGQMTVSGGGSVWSLTDQVLLQHGQCRLVKNGSNLTLNSFNGKYLIINGVPQVIPSAGVSLASTSLTPSTLYYIYAWMNSGTMTLEASTTGHSADSTTGVEIKTGDATRTLVGMARPITGPAWQDTAAQRFVSSYFNRRELSTYNTIAAGTTTGSTTPVELTTAVRNEFLVWADDIADMTLSTAFSNSSGTVTYAGISFDGSACTAIAAVQNSGLISFGSARDTKTGLSEGYHYATFFGWVGSASTGSFIANQTIPTLNGNVKG